MGIIAMGKYNLIISALLVSSSTTMAINSNTKV